MSWIGQIIKTEQTGLTGGLHVCSMGTEKRPRSREQVGECEGSGALGEGQMHGARRLGSKRDILDVLRVGGQLAVQVQIMRGQSNMSLGFREEEGA